jgi:hypothetical protein
MSLDHKIQTFDGELAALGVKISQTAAAYKLAQTLGIEATKAQELEWSLLGTDTAAYMKQHPVTKKTYEAFYRQLNSMIVGKINNLPPIDGLAPKIEEILKILNSPEVKGRLTDKHLIYDICDKQNKLLAQLTEIHAKTAIIKDTTNKFYKACDGKHKQLEAASLEVGRKLLAASPAGRERDARAAAGGAVHPAVEENKRGV